MDAEARARVRAPARRTDGDRAADGDAAAGACRASTSRSAGSRRRRWSSLLGAVMASFGRGLLRPDARSSALIAAGTVGVAALVRGSILLIRETALPCASSASGPPASAHAPGYNRWDDLRAGLAGSAARRAQRGRRLPGDPAGRARRAHRGRPRSAGVAASLEQALASAAPARRAWRSRRWRRGR